MFTQLQDFVGSLTDQMERSNNTIKNLSLSMYEIISFYKELIDASKKLNDGNADQALHIFEIINQA